MEIIKGLGERQASNAPSCRTPAIFSAFGQLRRQGFQPAVGPADPRQPIDEFAPSPLGGLTARRTTGLFLGGMAAAISGRWVLRGLRGGKPAQPVRFETNNILKNDPEKLDEMNVAQGFSEALSSIYRLALADPTQRKALLAYVGSSVLGYVAGSAAQGVQETWVRREETRIRAGLINRLQDVFRNSIERKQDFDATLKADAQRKIYQLLLRNQVPDAHALVEDRPIIESAQINRHYFYEPTHRTVPAAQIRFGQAGYFAQDDHTAGPLAGKRLVDAGIFGLGAFVGLALQGFVRLLTAPAESAVYNGKKVVYETIQVKDKEAWWVNGVKNRRNLAVLGGFFAISAAAKVGKMVIDGLREIEVTRVNARTEQDYQAYNWQQLDPDFHRIAEEAAFDHEFKRLAQDLPYLRQQPPVLKARIQAILSNIGRNSAPKYFPMTPPVGLVVARS